MTKKRVEKVRPEFPNLPGCNYLDYSGFEHAGILHNVKILRGTGILFLC